MTKEYVIIKAGDGWLDVDIKGDLKSITKRLDDLGGFIKSRPSEDIIKAMKPGDFHLFDDDWAVIFCTAERDLSPSEFLTKFNEFLNA